MRKLIAAAVGITTVVGLSTGSAKADSCHGDIVGKDIASTWPYAHQDRSQFPPPKGGFAAWVEILGFEGQPGAENQAIRDFCRG